LLAAQQIPIDIVLVIQSVIVLFIAAPPLVRTVFRLPKPGSTRKVRRPDSRAAVVAAGDVVPVGTVEGGAK
jgi:simple sugar transport system permease protein